ncbi:short-chain alcohol dehydrogenase [Diatrype stigma]|uniref:Short-chain alcohol dehydrogenase n=1 Tax=Diatrype stigma TaxID=117547 RepID=A0AAN9UWW1_9PEZI
MSLSLVRRLASQWFPPAPKFTGEDVSSLDGKVYLVTGANTGIGKELADILYSKNAKVYVAARSKEKAAKAIEEIKARSPQSKGELVFLHLDLADLTTIKASAEEFLSREDTLHVLFNNAGVMLPLQGSKTAQGYELQLGTNNVGTFLFTKLLAPALVATAKVAPRGSVRVVWVSSSAAEMLSPSGGVPLDNLDYHNDRLASTKYGVSKAGNYFHATEFAKRYRDDGVVSVALNPGNLDSELYRSQAPIVNSVLRLLVLYPSIYGAYTELFAGLSPDVTLEKSGEWIAPWGRFSPIREDLVASSKSKAEGGTGAAEEFWAWSEQQIKPYV